MATSFAELTVEDAAKEAAGSWRNFECFVWHRQSEVADADNWAIMYTNHRDSGLIDQSNASVIEKALKAFTEGEDADVVFERHFHWAVGHIDGFSIRVYRNGAITEAYRTYRGLQQRIADYLILDEEDHSNREYEATIQNIRDTVRRLKREYDLPEGWKSEAYDWLSENSFHAIENRDDQCGCPSEDELNEAFEALGFQRRT
jgi:hypothetical protein